ncbi:MAG TPA: hypothetical protein VGJ42_02395 [Nitrososphaera sp.]
MGCSDFHCALGRRLEVGVFYSGLARGAEIVGDKIKENPAVQDARTLPRTGRAHT